MDIKSEKAKCQEQITALEKQLSETSFNLKVAKAKLRKWETLEVKAQEIANQ